jgi:hypothetical protein
MLADLEMAKASITNSIQRASLQPIAGHCGLGDAGASGAFSPYLPWPAVRTLLRMAGRLFAT